MQRPREDLRYKYALTHEWAVSLIEQGRALVPRKYLTGEAPESKPETPVEELAIWQLEGWYEPKARGSRELVYHPPTGEAG